MTAPSRGGPTFACVTHCPSLERLPHVPGNELSRPTSLQLPLLPLRDVVVFPHMVIPLFVGRPKSIKALDVAMDAGKHILLVAQKQAAKDDPGAEDLYDIGTVATILQMLKLPDGTVKVLVEGTQRARIASVDRSRRVPGRAEAMPLAGDPGSANEVEAMRRALLAQFDQYVKLNKKIPPEILTSLSGIDDGGRLADTIAAHLPLKLEQKQQILEMSDVGKRLEHLLGVIEGEIDILQVEKRIRGRVKRQMEKSQREYYLNEQVKAIQKELGEGDENADLEELEKKIKAASMSKEARRQGDGRAEEAEADVADVGRSDGRAQLHRLAARPAVDKKSKISKDLANAEQGARRRPLRPREGQGAHRRVPRGAAARRQAEGARSCASSARPAWARPRSASRSRGRPTASSCACRWAACATRPRSAAIAAPTSARCPARSCRT